MPPVGSKLQPFLVTPTSPTENPSANQMKTAAMRSSGTESLRTLRWREPDSNHRSRKATGLLGIIPIDLWDRFFSTEKCDTVGKCYRRFQSSSLQQRVRCELDLGEGDFPAERVACGWLRGAAQGIRNGTKGRNVCRLPV